VTTARANPAPSAKTLDAVRRFISECCVGIANAHHIAKEARKLAPDPRAAAVEADALRQEATWRKLRRRNRALLRELEQRSRPSIRLIARVAAVILASRMPRAARQTRAGRATTQRRTAHASATSSSGGDSSGDPPAAGDGRLGFPPTQGTWEPAQRVSA